MSILSQFTFKGRQEEAAQADFSAIAVTAGAGSGKTRVLTGRFLHLLEQGYPLRSLIAVTFTEKAAREMRTRVRAELERWASREDAMHEPSSRIETALADLDAARIGTIHSLCAEIVRAYPAEAGVDPGFDVLEEGLAAVLRAHAIEAALAWAAGEATAAPLFTQFKEDELRRLLSNLFSRRLDLETWLAGSDNKSKGQSPLPAWSSGFQRWLDDKLTASGWQCALIEISQLQARNSEDKLELTRLEVLARWEEVQSCIPARQWDAALLALNAMRKAITANVGSKNNWAESDLESVRSALRFLSNYYDEQLKPLAYKSRWSLDERAADLLPSLHQLVRQMLSEYGLLKDERQSLDFDDLEMLAARLLAEFPGVRARWQSEIRGVMVDEFQDTNDRQRQIVYALTGFTGQTKKEPANFEILALDDDLQSPAPNSTSNLFIVGDAKQSIYKFRGADVTVFRQVQADIAAAGGLMVDLALTFRAHQPLLDALNPLLAEVMDSGEFMVGDKIAAQAYQTPFSPLHADRAAPEIARPPFIEFHLGLGDDSNEGRAVAASALAERLYILRREERFEWSDIALLFRASTAFVFYETALEQAGIPFVTIAGRGFYNRPEIRDLLNALAALSDPTDHLALAGLLRSPAFALSDADLYRLFFPASSMHEVLEQAVNGAVGEADQERLALSFRGWPALQSSSDPLHRRAVAIISELHDMAGRAPVAEVLKRLLDLTGYRAILRSVRGGERMTRNVDKLLADAHRSRLVGLGDFLEYVQTLRDVGMREGESPVEASGAVQLMTVHKSKGLEFPVVALADAAYEPRPPAAGALLDAQFGLLPGLKGEDEFCPVAWRLAYLDDYARSDAEDRRLLYVATTRAKEKLLVSGHCKLLKSNKLSLRGWLGDLGSAMGVSDLVLDRDLLASQNQNGKMLIQEGSAPWLLYTTGSHFGVMATHKEAPPEIETIPGDLLAPLSLPEPDKSDERSRSRETDPPDRVWRVVPRAGKTNAPAWVVGKLVHEALRRWKFPEAGFEAFMHPYAIEAGLADEPEIRASVREAAHILEQFHIHPLYLELNTAVRYHELPYLAAGEQGVIDLLYRYQDHWVVLDFKTDRARSETEAREIIRREGYEKQMQRYIEAVSSWMGSRPIARLVFLQVAGGIQIFDV